jgi:type III secretion system chaperone SycN
MNRLATTLKAFGDEIGLEGLSLRKRHHLTLQMESGLRVAVEAAENDVLVYASEPVAYEGAERLLRAWRQAYFNRLKGRPVQAALREEDETLRLLAVARLPADDFSVQTLRETVSYLARWLDATRAD